MPYFIFGIWKNFTVPGVLNTFKEQTRKKNCAYLTDYEILSAEHFPKASVERHFFIDGQARKTH